MTGSVTVGHLTHSMESLAAASRTATGEDNVNAVVALRHAYEERAQMAAAKAAQCRTNGDFDSVEWFRGVAAGFRQAAAMAEQSARAASASATGEGEAE